MMSKSIAIVFPNTLSNSMLRDEIAHEIRERGYVVDVIHNGVYVNGTRNDDGSLKVLDPEQALEVVAPYQERKSPTLDGTVRLDVVFYS